MSYNNYAYQALNITSSTYVQIATGLSTVHSVVVNATGASMIVVNGNTGTTAIIATIAANASTGTYLFDAVCSEGLRVISFGTANATVMWQKP